MSVDKRFALIDSDGFRRYPYLSQNSSGGYGFVIGRSGKARHTTSIEDVIRAVVLGGESMRAKALDGPHANQGNSLKLHAKRKIVGFHVSPELVHLVENVSAEASPPSLSPQPPAETGIAAADRLNQLKVSDLSEALCQLQETVTPGLRELLEVHAGAPDHRARLSDLLHGVETGRASALALEYANFARAIGARLGLPETEGLLDVIAFGNDTGADSLWVLRPQMLAALEKTGTIESTNDTPNDTSPFPAPMESDPAFQSATPTVRRALINARVGQGGYRRRMLALWGNRCAVTGCRIEQALIASHAKAWAAGTNVERLDEFNGLLLSASLDRLFDTGLISFADDGRMLCSPVMEDSDLSAVGLRRDSSLHKVHPRHRPYLQAHRRQFGFD